MSGPTRRAVSFAVQELAETAAQLEDLAALRSVTDEELLAASGLVPAISPYELVSGVPHTQVINAAFSWRGKPTPEIVRAPFERKVRQAK
jgi:hypothetical protein